MSVRFLALALVMSAQGAAADVLGDSPINLSPMSRTATAITGPLIASQERVVFFEASAIMDVNLIDNARVGAWESQGEPSAAQLFAVQTQVGELLQGNTLCGGDPVGYMTVRRVESFGSEFVEFAFYGGTKEPGGAESTTFCGTYSFTSDEVASASTQEADVVATGPILPEAQEFSPASRWSNDLTGPIVASATEMRFETGATLALELVDDAVRGQWNYREPPSTAQVFRVTGDAGALRNNLTLCNNRPVTFAAAWGNETFGNDWINLEFFHSETMPTASAGDNSCGTGFGYSLPSVEPEAPVETAEFTGGWTVRTETNVLDDSPTVFLRLVADRGANHYGDDVTMIARCKSNRTELFINWNDYLGDDSYNNRGSWKRVVVRLGDSPAVEQQWGTSTDSQATFAPDWAGNLLRQMVREDRMVVQTTPYNESPVTAVFDIRGLEPGLRQLASTCNWTF